MVDEYPLYVYIDESGDFNFSPNGSRFYTITAIITHKPSERVEEFTDLRHRILSEEICPGLGQDYLERCLCKKFHATEDKQIVRDQFFDIIQRMTLFRAHSIVVRKNRANPTIRMPHR